MRELSARVLEEESAIDCKCCGEEIHKQDHEEKGDWSPVFLDQNGFIGNEEFHLPHEPEGEGEQYGDSQDESIAYHLNAWSSRKYVIVIPSGLIGIRSLG